MSMLQHYAYALAYDFVLSWLTSVCMCICGHWIINFCTLWAYWFYDISHHMHLWIKSTLLMHSGCLRCFIMHGKLKKIYIFFFYSTFFVSWTHCHHHLTVPNQLQLLLLSTTGSHCRSVPVTAAPNQWPESQTCCDVLLTSRKYVA